MLSIPTTSRAYCILVLEYVNESQTNAHIVYCVSCRVWCRCSASLVGVACHVLGLVDICSLFGVCVCVCACVRACV